MAPATPPPLRIDGSILRGWQTRPGTVHVHDGHIAGRGRRGERRITLPDGWILAPGFWDLQLNGFAGDEVADDTAALGRIARRLPSVGVTAFCPTLITRTLPAYTAAADALRAARWPAAGARPLGVHLEGPFLNPKRRGAHPWRGLADPSPDRLAALVDVFAPRIVTLAPELDGGLDAVAALARAGIVAAVGHTEAGAGLCTKAIAAGARLLTHALNAMPPVTAREPGPLGAFLADRRCHVAVIADGVHLAPATLAILERAAGRQLLVVSDAVAAAGAPAGPSTLSGRRVISDGSRVRDARGRLAGSARPISDGPAALRALGRPAAQALAAAATAPRALLGATDPFAAGQPADLVVVDETLRPRVTFIAGRVVWNDTDLAIPS